MLVSQPRRSSIRCLAAVVLACLGGVAGGGCRYEGSTGPPDTNATAPRPARGKEPVAELPPASPPVPEPIVLFDGRSLDGWRIVDKFDFEQHGEVSIQDGTIVLEQGSPATGISWTKDHPRMNYEISLEAQRVEGSDFFCGLTCPVGESHITLIVGGWGGGIVGLSNVDDASAAENETTSFVEFEQKRWYAIRLQITEDRIQAWIDDEQLIDLDATDRKFSIWWEVEPLRPLGISTWFTTAALRNIRIKPVAGEGEDAG